MGQSTLLPNAIQSFAKVIPQYNVQAQPMAPPTGGLYFMDSIVGTGTNTRRYEGNLFIVFYGASLVQGAYLTYEEAQAVTTSDEMIVPIWFDSDNNKLCRKLYVFYDEDRRNVLVSRIESKIDTSWRDSLYKYRSTLVLDIDSMCYAVEVCDANPSYDILTELPNWVAKYGIPYH